MRKISTEDFIKKARLVHDDKYDYSKTVYDGAFVKVYVICPTHGEFKQRANDHKQGNGCPKCAREESSQGQRNSKEQFISKAKTVHGDRYDYSSSNYTSNKSKVNIICSIHGKFEQRPSDHLSGYGCYKCTLDGRRTSQSEFINKAKMVHGDRYDYSRAIYKSSDSPVYILCEHHGLFKPLAREHVRGTGCPKCSNNVKLTTLGFISKAEMVHGDRYDYSLCYYDGRTNKIDIICPEHVVFKQNPGDHLQGKGCSSCSLTGFDDSKDAVLYVISDLDMKYMKIGITGNINNRFTRLKYSTPFEIQMINAFDICGSVARNVEKAIHGMCDHVSLGDFEGYSEWFTYDNHIVSMLENVLFAESV